MHHVHRIAVTSKAPADLLQNPEPPLHLAQQQSPAVRAQLSTVKLRYHVPPSNRLETELFDRTLCLHHAVAPVLLMLLVTLNLIARRGGVLLIRVRNAGYPRFTALHVRSRDDRARGSARATKLRAGVCLSRALDGATRDARPFARAGDGGDLATHASPGLVISNAAWSTVRQSEDF